MERKTAGVLAQKIMGACRNVAPLRIPQLRVTWVAPRLSKLPMRHFVLIMKLQEPAIHLYQVMPVFRV